MAFWNKKSLICAAGMDKISRNANFTESDYNCTFSYMGKKGLLFVVYIYRTGSSEHRLKHTLESVESAEVEFPNVSPLKKLSMKAVFARTNRFLGNCL